MERERKKAKGSGRRARGTGPKEGRGEIRLIR